MAKLRRRTAKQAPIVMGRGNSGYRLHGERYVFPTLPGLRCPQCEKSIAHDKKTGLFACPNCDGKFTSVQIQQHIQQGAQQREAQTQQEWRAAQEALAEERRIARAIKDSGATSVVYYIRFRDAVKIGTSVNLAARISAQPWEELVGVEPGGVELERKRHKDLRSARLDGEWFELTSDVRTYIEDVNRVNAKWYAQVFSCAGPLPVTRGRAKFPALSNYPKIC